MYSLLKKTIIILIISNCFLISCSEELPPEKKALKIAKYSYVLNEEKPVYRFIDDFIRQKGDNAKPGVWKVEKITDNKYLVSYKYKLYSFNEGIGEKGFFFEVDLETGSVIDRTKEYLEKMTPLSNAYKSEKELFKEIINEDESMTIEP